MHSPLPSFENHLPRRVITGRGASQSLAALCQTNGWSRVFVVSDAGVAGAGLLRQVALPLRAETFAEVPPEPPIDVVDTLALRMKASGAEAVIALGGGSVMDAAKVASLAGGQHNFNSSDPVETVSAQPRNRSAELREGGIFGAVSNHNCSTILTWEAVRAS
jgi:alcohol dehydrogenase class IV